MLRKASAMPIADAEHATPRGGRGRRARPRGGEACGWGRDSALATERPRERRFAIKAQRRQHADAGHNDPLRRCKIRHIRIDTVVAYTLVFFGSGSSPLFFA